MNDHDTSAVESKFDCLPPDEKDSLDESFLSELALDNRNHALATSADHSPVIDQLVRSAVSQAPPDLLVAVTSFSESMALMFVEFVPIDLTLKCLRTATHILKSLLQHGPMPTRASE